MEEIVKELRKETNQYIQNIKSAEPLLEKASELSSILECDIEFARNINSGESISVVIGNNVVKIKALK